MSKVSYFQRFSQRENHATNNTLLVLRYLYQSSPTKLERVLSGLLGEELQIGLSFEQQVRKSVSVPDAVIEQKPFRIVIETKLGGELDHDQIRRHVISMKADPIGSHFRSVLIGLTRGAVTDAARAELTDFAKEQGVQFVAVTFEDVEVALRQACAEHEVGLLAIIEDYRSFLESENLIDDRGRWMVMFPCGTSYAENAVLKLYYEPPHRPSRRGCRYLGIYRDKTVSLVGEMAAVLICSYDAGTIRVDQREFGRETPEMLARIKQAFEETTYYDLRPYPLRLYLVEDWVPCHFPKVTPGGIMGARYIDLLEHGFERRQLAGQSAETVANVLNSQVFR